jgi:metal-responsive CopG/Arc/MetJ family transcriptional regulator
MHTKKVAITIPKDILILIDNISQAKGISRSKLITSMLEQKLAEEKATYLKHAYNSVFENDAVKAEQRSTALWFEKAGNEGGQEW